MRKGRSVLAPALKQLNAPWLSACVVDGLDALALVLEVEFLVAAVVGKREFLRITPVIKIISLLIHRQFIGILYHL
jgi:hypothetical protein